MKLAINGEMAIDAAGYVSLFSPHSALPIVFHRSQENEYGPTMYGVYACFLCDDQGPRNAYLAWLLKCLISRALRHVYAVKAGTRHGTQAETCWLPFCLPSTPAAYCDGSRNPCFGWRSFRKCAFRTRSRSGAFCYRSAFYRGRAISDGRAKCIISNPFFKRT